MSDCCDHSEDLKFDPRNTAFKRVLWIALIFNFGMFFVEVIYGVLSNSLSLRADAIDFLGDSANYFVTLFVLNSALKTKAKVSSAKALFMIGFGAWILVEAVMRFFSQEVPNPFTMSWVGLLALAINGLCAFLYLNLKTATPTCNPYGFAQETTPSETSRLSWLLPASIGGERNGPI